MLRTCRLAVRMVRSDVGMIVMSIHSSSTCRFLNKIWTPRQICPPYEHVTQVGDPLLRRLAEAVPLESINGSDIQLLISQMVSVLDRYNCVGLAAPQIGVPYRVIALQFKSSLKKQFSDEQYRMKEMETLPLTIIINPELRVVDYNKRIFAESCESVKGYSADVARYNAVSVTGFDPTGATITRDFTGWNARIVQHEIDHIDGILYTDRMNAKTLSCSCWEAVNRRAGRVVLPFGPK